MLLTAQRTDCTPPAMQGKITPFRNDNDVTDCSTSDLYAGSPSKRGTMVFRGTPGSLFLAHIVSPIYSLQHTEGGKYYDLLLRSHCNHLSRKLTFF